MALAVLLLAGPPAWLHPARAQDPAPETATQTPAEEAPPAEGAPVDTLEPGMPEPPAERPAPPPAPAGPMPTNARDILVDPMTGLALLGYDPVAYFVDRRPRLGAERFEFLWSGVVWRFVNEGNMAAFAAAPEVYAPQFGGYDPLALASGSMTHGDPAIWLIHDTKLYFFFSPSKRFLWLSAAEQNKAAAERFWKERAR